jgi:hypothetical protein
VGLMSGLDVSEEEKNHLPLLGIELRFLGYQTHSLEKVVEQEVQIHSV